MNMDRTLQILKITNWLQKEWIKNPELNLRDLVADVMEEVLLIETSTFLTDDDLLELLIDSKKYEREKE